MTERKPFLEMPKLKLSVGMVSFDPADVREMREKYEARIAELETALVKIARKSSDNLSAAIAEDALGQSVLVESHRAQVSRG